MESSELVQDDYAILFSTLEVKERKNGRNRRTERNLNMSLKSAFIIATVAVMAFASSSDAFAAKKSKNKRAQNHIAKHQKLYAAKRRGLPVYVIMGELRERGFRRLRVRGYNKTGYSIKACKRGRKVMLGVNRWGDIKWRERIGKCFHFYKYRDFGNSINFEFRL
ncbi:MAG: hypothetical protein ACR2PH_13755 [Desulfobulbia bacterium]